MLNFRSVTPLNWNFLESRGIPNANVNYLLLNPSRWWGHIQCHIRFFTPWSACFSSSFHMSLRWTKENFFKFFQAIERWRLLWQTYHDSHPKGVTKVANPPCCCYNQNPLASLRLIASVRFCHKENFPVKVLNESLPDAHMYHIWENICVNAGRDTHLHHLHVSLEFALAPIRSYHTSYLPVITLLPICLSILGWSLGWCSANSYRCWPISVTFALGVVLSLFSLSVYPSVPISIWKPIDHNVWI